MKFAIFYVTAIAIVVFGLDGAAAAPPVKIGNGPVVNRVEYIYYDVAGNIAGNKIYGCDGWVVGWGEKAKYVEVKVTPCERAAVVRGVR